jgi:hypothetical protein
MRPLKMLDFLIRYLPPAAVDLKIAMHYNIGKNATDFIYSKHSFFV